MSRGGRKKPKKEKSVSTAKKPAGVPITSDKDYVQWCFSIFDRYCWHDNDHKGDSFNNIANHLKGYQGLTWAGIKRKDHPVPKNKLITEARDRLSYLNQDDIDELWRLELTGLQRLWGIRNQSIFRALWWDPQHKIYPTKKKHT